MRKGKEMKKLVVGFMCLVVAVMALLMIALFGKVVFCGCTWLYDISKCAIETDWISIIANCWKAACAYYVAVGFWESFVILCVLFVPFAFNSGCILDIVTDGFGSLFGSCICSEIIFFTILTNIIAIGIISFRIAQYY